MAIPDDSALFREVSAMQQAGLIPVRLVVFDEASGEEVQRHLVGCFAVPRVGEVVHCDGAAVGVFGVSHDFNTSRDLQGATVRLQVITVAGYAERGPTCRARASYHGTKGRKKSGRASGR